VFIVDDSCHGGYALKAAKRLYKGPDPIWAVVYNRERNTLPDVYAVDMDIHIFQWNVWNNGQTIGRTTIKGLNGGFAVDLDLLMGKDGAPIYLPRLNGLPLVVGNRPETDKQEVMDWFAKWGVVVKRLVLCENDVIECKAKHFRESPTSVFWEADLEQCQPIANLANKPVIEPESGKVFYAE
jgi:hypothetical protein